MKDIFVDRMLVCLYKPNMSLSCRSELNNELKNKDFPVKVDRYKETDEAGSLKHAECEELVKFLNESRIRNDPLNFEEFIIERTFDLLRKLETAMGWDPQPAAWVDSMGREVREELQRIAEHGVDQGNQDEAVDDDDGEDDDNNNENGDDSSNINDMDLNAEASEIPSSLGSMPQQSIGESQGVVESSGSEMLLGEPSNSGVSSSRTALVEAMSSSIPSVVAEAQIGTPGLGVTNGGGEAGERSNGLGVEGNVWEAPSPSPSAGETPKKKYSTKDFITVQDVKDAVARRQAGFVPGQAMTVEELQKLEETFKATFQVTIDDFIQNNKKVKNTMGNLKIQEEELVSCF